MGKVDSLSRRPDWEIGVKKDNEDETLVKSDVTNFIRPYLHQFFDNSHGINSYGKPLKSPFD